VVYHMRSESAPACLNNPLLINPCRYSRRAGDKQRKAGGAEDAAKKKGAGPVGKAGEGLPRAAVAAAAAADGADEDDLPPLLS
jgi:hypothetical protein